VRNSNVLVRVELTALTRADLAVLSELKRQHPELAGKLSRAALKILFREKRVRLVDKRALSASDDLFPGTHLIEILDWNPEADLSPEPSYGPDTEILPVLFEDEDLLVLHKNSGTPSVPLEPHENRTAVSSALRYLEASNTEKIKEANKDSHKNSVQTFIQIGKSSGHPLEAGLLHRLDTGTSGVLAFAKNKTEFDRIRALWKTPHVRKFYRAIVCSNTLSPLELKRLPFTITTPIGHDPKSSKRMLALTGDGDRSIRGKSLDAITHILGAKFFSQGSTPLWELQLEIETGVMHQIRVHLSSIGLPILGDPLYGSKIPLSADSLLVSRLFLHHERLELLLRNGTVISVQAPLPANWLTATTS
jgi:23S rRNA pseudouridine1911/1915/1917 synthase